MTVAITIARTQADSPQASFERSFGQADLVASAGLNEVERFRDLVPTDAEAVETFSSYSSFSAPDGTVERGEFRVIPFADPLVEGIIDVTAGRAPTSAGEVLLSRDVAAGFGVDVGDSLVLSRPSGAWDVVGIGRQASQFSTPLFAVAEFPWERLHLDSGVRQTLVGLPDATTDAQLSALSAYGGVALSPQLDPRGESAFGGTEEVGRSALAWGWVAGALALAAVGVIVAAAFASSARRQLVTIGQLASNGAPERLIRRTLALQGAWTGLIGATAAIVVGSVAVRFARPLVERVVGRELGPWQVDLVALAVIGLTGVAAATIAALFPARSAARVPPLSALAGRRPLGDVPRRLVPIGITLFVSGVALLVLVTVASSDSSGGDNANVYAAFAVIGGLLVIAGMCCASPIAVDVIGRVGARLSGTWRLGSRSIARARTRSAGVVTAIAMTGAVATAVTTAVGSVAFGDEDRVPTTPSDAVVVSFLQFESDGTGRTTSIEPVDIDVATRTALDAALPDATVTALRVASPQPPIDSRFGDPGLVVADEAIIDMIGLSDRDLANFERAGFLDVFGWVIASAAESSIGSSTTIPGGIDASVDIVTPQDPIESGGGHWSLLVTEQQAIELGLPIIEAGLVLRSPRDLTGEQQQALGRLQESLWERPFADIFVEPGDPPIPTDDNQPFVARDVRFATESSQFPRALVDAIAVAVALLLALLVVAIGLSLAATESRDERDVLLAVGASPSTLRSLAAIKAVVLTVGAAALAIPTGFIPVAAILRAGTDDTIVFPWLTAAGLLFAVPAIAGLAARSASAVARRVRPTHMSNLATD